MQLEKQASDSYRPKNMSLPVASIGVTVQFGNNKKGKKGKQAPMGNENLKMNNYELLKRLGFDRDFIDENKRLGLKEKQTEMRMAKHQYLME